MDFTYDAMVSEHEDGWFVEFPSFDGGAFADGDTLQGALAGAATTLRLVIAEYLDRGWPLPAAGPLGSQRCIFTVEISDDFIAESKCVTPGEAADILGVSAGRVSQMLNAGVLEAYAHGGKRLVTLASVNARKEAGPRSGRPRKALEA